MAKGVLSGHRDFRLLWGGETVSELGSQVGLLALPLLAVRTLLGRMNATMRFVVWGVLPIGALIDGMLGSVAGRPTLWPGSGCWRPRCTCVRRPSVK